MTQEELFSLPVQELPVSWKLKTFMFNNEFANLNEMLNNSFWDLVMMGCELKLMTELYLFLERNKLLSSLKSN